MMNQRQPANLNTYCLILGLMVLMAVGLKSIDITTGWQKAGLINLSIGFSLLMAYVVARILNSAGLPLISGYIFTGIVTGPYVTNFLSTEMILQLKLIDDLALSFIALIAGGALRLDSLRVLLRSLLLNSLFQTLAVFGLAFFFIVKGGQYFEITQTLSPTMLIILAILLGVISIARSPSSAIAIISECRAEGPFTETVLGVTVFLDVLIIVLFTIAMTISQLLVSGAQVVGFAVISALSIQLVASLMIGAVLGKGISFYIEKIGHDLFLFLLFIAFAVTKTSFWLCHFMKSQYHVYLHLEPLLICMSAGFVVQNFGSAGTHFIKILHRMSLPIYILFFTLAGAALNLKSLALCWPLAASLVIIRMVGIFCGSWFSGVLTQAPKIHSHAAWMAYLTQAGVAIGLAQLARQKFPLIGDYLNTIVLAVISINQILGPVTFKVALNLVKESRR